MSDDIAVLDLPLTTTEQPIQAGPVMHWGPVRWRQSSSLAAKSRWESQAQTFLMQAAKLPSNWDSYGSPPPTTVAIDVAEELISILALTRSYFTELPVPHVGPVSGGGIQLEWRVGERELDFEVLPDGAIEYSRVGGGNPGEEGRLRLLDIASLLGWLSSPR